MLSCRCRIKVGLKNRSNNQFFFSNFSTEFLWKNIPSFIIIWTNCFKKWYNLIYSDFIVQLEIKFFLWNEILDLHFSIFIQVSFHFFQSQININIGNTNFIFFFNFFKLIKLFFVYENIFEFPMKNFFLVGKFL